mgnify:CR=1 FL=1|jgi:polysaccharide pyruvyl transferase WcaK-like protein
MKRNVIGIFGAIGYDDYGDDALLLCNVEELLKRNYNIVIFSYNVARTTNLLLSNGLLPSNARSERIEIVMDLNGYIDRKKWVSYSNIILNLGVDAIKTAYYLYLHRKLSQSMTDLHSVDSDLSDFVGNVSKCSLILNMGGGYMNLYHGAKIYSSIVALSIANKMGKPVIAYGQTFGPLNKVQKHFVKKFIQKIHHISVRDIDRSKKRLIELGVPEKHISEGPDDAIFLNRQILNYQNEDILNQFEGKFIVITNFGLFLKYSRMSIESIHSVFATFFDYLIEEKNAVILNISMTSSGADVGQGLSIQEKMKNKKSLFHLPLYVGVKEIKAIIGKSDLVFSSRLHPIVFAISEKKPYIGISSGGEYYDSKLMGISEIYGYDPSKHIINADNLSLDLLIQCFNKALDDEFTDKDGIYKLNKLKRKQDLDAIEQIIERHKY